MTNFMAYVANARKAVVQFLTLVVTLGAAVATFQSALPEKYAALITAAVGLAGTLLHYLTSNAPAPGTAPATEDFVPSDDDEGEAIPDEFKPAALVTASQVASNNEIAAPPSPTPPTAS